ncbi:MAG TPA: protein kinase [Kofleriaceae bacterium]|nr:protein kinase [Kofleriaceae bacterium]
MGSFADRYEIVRPLGRGGMGEVVLARQLNLDRLVVLKRVVDGSPRYVEALLAEARIAAQLHHPNIVSIFDVSGADEEPYVAMELVLGATLRELIDRAPNGMPVDVALPIAIDLLRGLSYAHASHSGLRGGVVHRDVKPRNVMVTFGGTAKLIDFGISRWLDDAGHLEATSISGTRGYMAPEQQRGGHIDGRADQYALAITLREMLTGVPPVSDLAEQMVVPATAIDPDLATIVDRGAALDPSDRFPDCDTLLAALEAYANARALALSATRVARWTCSELADRRAALDKELARPRRRPPTAPTIAERNDHEPRSSTYVVLRATNRGASEHAWLGPVVERMTRTHLLHARDRCFSLAPTDDGTELALELVYEPMRDGIQIEAIEVVSGSKRASTHGASVWAATAELSNRLTRELVTSKRVVPDADEAVAMRLLGTVSVLTYRAYCEIVSEMLVGGVIVDSETLARRVDELIAADPEWIHLYALLAVLHGTVTPSAIAALDAGRERIGSTDTRGQRVLAALRHEASGDYEGACEVLSKLYRDNASDVLVASELLMASSMCQRVDDVIAIARRMDRAVPALEFGADLAAMLRRIGDTAEAEAVIRDTLARAPESPTAALDLIRIESEANHLDEAAALARDMLLVHGERDNILALLFEAFILCEQPVVARRFAERMLMCTDVLRARGRYRLGVAALFEGRFAAAYDSSRRALAELRPYGLQAELSQCLELLATLSSLVGDHSGKRRYVADLASLYSDMLANHAAAAATRYELALLQGEEPSIDDLLAAVPDGPQRDIARRRMLRAGALAGRIAHAEAVAAGFSADEENPAALLAFGLCARHEGELALARRSLDAATRQWSSTYSNQASPYPAVLARFHLAGVLAELGDRAGARTQYERFLRCWGNADRPLPEVVAARRALAELA